VYDIRATPEARRHLDKLPPKIAHAALALIHSGIAGDPHRVGKPLVGELAGLWSARRSEYRVVDEIDDAARTVTVHRVQHRRDVYRTR
jgi:mRNA-degrading endonuclease RelE of RelBE toxin-antitoxin system